MDALKPCKHPGCDGTCHPELMPHSRHYAKWVCGSCGKWNDWVRKPSDDASKYRRPAAHRKLVAKFGRGYCEMCMRQENELRDEDTLEGHHSIEFKDGGEPTRENTWILCTACHRLVNWMRTYHGRTTVDESN